MNKAIKAYQVTFGLVERDNDYANHESFTVLAEDVIEAVENAKTNLETIKRGRTAGKVKGNKYPSEVKLLIDHFD